MLHVVVHVVVQVIVQVVVQLLLQVTVQVVVQVEVQICMPATDNDNATTVLMQLFGNLDITPPVMNLPQGQRI